MNKRLAITLIIAFFLITGTIIAIKFAKGYRLDLKNKTVSGTGLLVANSFPDGAQVFINDKLTTATNDTLNLLPGDYQVKINKDGFITWEKKLKLIAEQVTQTNAHLFPAVPDLTALTTTGALNFTPSPNGQKIAYSVASASAKAKNGLWVLELNNSTLGFNSNSKQITQNSSVFDFTSAQLFWSPDSQQILGLNENNAVLLDANNYKDPNQIVDVSAKLPLLLSDWQEQFNLKKERQWKKLPTEFAKIASQSADFVYFSPDEEKILYRALKDLEIPLNLASPLPGSNTQPEARKIEKGKVYVYDLKEDKNFYVGEAKVLEKKETKIQKELAVKEDNKRQNFLEEFNKIKNQYSPVFTFNFQWFPTSRHLILTEKGKITIMEYDGTNKATVYAGPFYQDFVYPWPDASKLIILTNLNPDSELPPNLYALSLK